MLQTGNSGNTNPNSALLALKPRQVLLAEQNAKTTATTMMTTKKKHNKTLTLKPEQKPLLLHSVLRYLELNGFSKTLKRFLSEAQIEDDKWKASSLDLEEMYCKYLETCSHADTNFNTYKDQELQTDGITKTDGENSSEETVSKKKKKISDKRDNYASADHSGAADKLTKSARNFEEILANDMVTGSNVKSKEKKKSRKIPDSLGETEKSSEALKEPIDDTVCRLQIDESTQKHKDKKKKKSKLTSESLDGNVEKGQLDPEALKEPNDDTVCELQLDESTKKHKDKKKKKSKLTSESLDGNVEGEQLDSLPGVAVERSKDLVPSKGDGKNDSEAKIKPKDKKKRNNPSTNPFIENVGQCGLEDKNGVIADKLVTDSALRNASNIPLEEKKVESKDKKRKKDGLVSEKLSGGVVEVLDKENLIGTTDSHKESFQTSENVTSKDKKDSKKRKRLASEENESQHVEKVLIEESKRRKTEGLEEANGIEQLTKANAPLGGNGLAGRESKGENGQVDLSDSQQISVKKLDEHANGNLEKNGVEKSALQRSMRKQRNGSAEPKTVNAFQRVKVGEVVFADEKLQDNSYWAKDGAEVGYGAKAQEILGQVRGRDFRHEKTKKKRGSYRGGQIDLQTHSIKFNYSDDD